MKVARSSMRSSAAVRGLCALATAAFALVPQLKAAPVADLTVGVAVDNVPDAKVSLIYPVDSTDIALVFRGKIKGTGVTVSNDDALLSYNGSVNAIVREGAALQGAPTPLAKFDDPVSENGRVYFTGKIAATGGVTIASDEVLCSVSSTGTGLTLVVREGDSAPGIVGATYKKVQWILPTAGGVFYAANYVVGTKAGLAVWYNDGASSVLIAGPGTALDVNGEAATIKTITLPTVVGAGKYVTRVGDADSVTLTVRTTTNAVVVKTFAAPVVVPPPPGI